MKLPAQSRLFPMVSALVLLFALALGSVSCQETEWVMVQSLREVSLSLVSGGQCEHKFTSPRDLDIMTFNYVARN